MYCKHCGAEIDERAYLCVKCGFLNGDGDSYCDHCGAEVEKGATVCMKCGFKIENKENKEDKKEEKSAEPKPEASASTVVPKSQLKSKMAAGLLGIFLGWIGVHNFYLGYTGKAVAQLLLGTIGLCFFGIGAIVSGVWGLVEGIFIFTGKIDRDAKGIPLSDDF